MNFHLSKFNTIYYNTKRDVIPRPKASVSREVPAVPATQKKPKVPSFYTKV